MIWHHSNCMREDIRIYWTSKEFQEKNAMAIQQVTAYLEELNLEYYKRYGTYFKRYIESRIKSVDSICAKLQRKNGKLTPDDMEERLNDMCGVRVICYDTNQMYRIVDLFVKGRRYEVQKEKDYVKKPKKNGYQSYHIICLVPVEIEGKRFRVKVELQIRTIIMDAWASIDAVVRYKKDKKISRELAQKIDKFAKGSRELDKIVKGIMEEEYI